jgi:hypothetical protein
MQLGAFLHDTLIAFDLHSQDKIGSSYARKLQAEKDRRFRMLRQKTRQAIVSLKDLNRYASGLHPVLGRKHKEVAMECLTRLSPYLKCDQDLVTTEIEEEKSYLPDRIKDPTAFNMVCLYWFYRSECLLSGIKAEIRVGQIRNEFWREYAKQVKVTTEYNEIESPGCAAVRIAVSRYI